MSIRQRILSNALHRVGRIGIAAAVGVLALSGCASMGPPAASIDVVHDHQPDDVPVPQRFTYDDRELASFAYIKFQEAPRLAMRSMRLTYWGDRPVQEVQRWYLDQMPKHGWRHVTTDGFIETHMRFTKGPERAEIYLKRTPDEDGRYYVTRLVVEIGVN
jgi:hypothetical protein